MSPSMGVLGAGLGLALLVTAGVMSRELEQSADNDLLGKFESEWPFGDPRRCQELFRLSKFDVKRFEILPGLGWDNLRNKEAGMVVSYNYSQCKVTDDGTLLIPDNVFTIPIKASSMGHVAEMVDNWHNASSITSNTINMEAGLNLQHAAISGKFSYEHVQLKSKQIEDNAITIRVQLRYYRYEAKLQPDATLSPQFKTRLLSIAANVELNRTEQAVYEGQVLVRDFGTHVLTSVTAGAALVKDDYLKRKSVEKQSEDKTSILASASASFYQVFNIKMSYGRQTGTNEMEKYEKEITHSSVKTEGGPIFKASAMTLNDWTNGVDKNLIAMDKAGDPLYFFVTPQTLPELPPTTVAGVEQVVRKSVELYYETNVIAGCTRLGAPNFSFSANVDDGSCDSVPTNLTFGGVYQTCTVSGKYLKHNPCDGLTETNPKTGGFSCPPSYMPVQLGKDHRNSNMEKSRHCKSCWLFWKCCHNKNHHSEALLTTYWCAAAGPVDSHSGYLFGGLYTSQTENLVTGSRACPISFYRSKLITGLSICISDDFEFGAKYSVPFGGFFSCETGNPLSEVRSNGTSEAPANSLPALMAKNGGPQSWPSKCPTGYSQHLAIDDLGCAIHYCVAAGSLSGPNLPPIKRPPFMAKPIVLNGDEDNLVVYDAETKTWIKKDEAAAKLQQTSSQHSSDSDDDYSLYPGAAAGLAICVTLACIALVVVVIVVIRRRRAKRRGADRHEEKQPADIESQEPESEKV